MSHARTKNVERSFVDTNILLYAHDVAAGPKHDRAQQIIEKLWTSRTGVLSTQVLQELCVNLQRKIAMPLPAEDIREVVHDYLSWEVVVNTPASVIQALDIQTRYKISFWDALILQAAEMSGAAVLYSEDFATGRNYGPIHVINPLL